MTTLLIADAARFDAHGRQEAESLANKLAPAAQFAKPFMDNARKPPRKESVIRARLRKILTEARDKNYRMLNDELWNEFKKKPPKGYTPMDNRLGRYIESPKAGKDCSYRRFVSIASELRTELGTSLRKRS